MGKKSFSTAHTFEYNGVLLKLVMLSIFFHKYFYVSIKYINATFYERLLSTQSAFASEQGTEKYKCKITHGACSQRHLNQAESTKLQLKKTTGGLRLF